MKETICGQTNLTKRDGTYCVRRATPKEVLDARIGAGQKAGPYERVKSLRTKDKAEAKRILRGVLDEFNAEWARELHALSPSPMPIPAGKHIPTDAELEAALSDLVARYRDTDEAKRARRVALSTLASVPSIKDKLTRGLATGDVSASVNRILARFAQAPRLPLAARLGYRPGRSQMRAVSRRREVRGV